MNRSRINNSIASIILALASAFTCAGCVTIYNPATEKKETFFIGTESEVSLGKDMDAQIQKKLKVSSDAAMQQRLNNISSKVAASSDRKDLTYYFKVINDKELNAFAIPGGYIYVNSGLMNASTDDELACVLAHEIGHIAARHSVKKLQSVLGYQLIMGIVVGVSGQQVIASAMDVFFNLTTLSYSREDELLADRLAVKYAKKSGFDPHGMVTFFRKLQEEATKKGGKLNIELFSSHPDIEKRIKHAEDEIAKLP